MTLYRRWRSIVPDEAPGTWTSVGLLLLRLGMGGFMLGAHGFSKLSKFDVLTTKFADPLGVGHTTSLLLALFAEVLCAALVVLGLTTRLAAIPLLLTMLVAAFVIHSDDPWQKKEFALLYAIPFLTLLATGPGRFSLDQLLAKRFDARM